jgi:hypothetical protein
MWGLKSLTFFLILFFFLKTKNDRI